MAAYVLHFVCPWMAYFSVPDRLSLDSILICFEQKAEKVGNIACLGVGSCVLVRGFSYVHLVFLELEGGGHGFNSSLELFSVYHKE